MPRIRIQNAYQFRRFGVWRFLTGEVMPTGQVAAFAGPVAPTGWLLCDGTNYPAASYPALLAVIGGIWGGNGTTNFSVPDLRGRVTIGVGLGAGLTNRSLTDSGGEEKHTISPSEVPAHNHGLSNLGGNNNMVNTALSSTNIGTGGTAVGLVPFTSVSTDNNSTAGSSANVMQPYKALNYIIKT